MMEPFDFTKAQEQEEFLNSLPPTDTRHRSMCEIDDDGKNITVYWGNYPYHIELDRIDDYQKLLSWVVHLGAKGWPNSTPQRMSKFVRMICAVKGWDIGRL